MTTVCTLTTFDARSCRTALPIAHYCDVVHHLHTRDNLTSASAGPAPSCHVFSVILS